MRQSECNCVAPIPLNTNSFSEACHRAPSSFHFHLPPARPLLSCRNLLTESASANSESLNFFFSCLFSVKHLFFLKSRAIPFSFSLSLGTTPSCRADEQGDREGGEGGVSHPQGHVITALYFTNISLVWLMIFLPGSVVDKVTYEERQNRNYHDSGTGQKRSIPKWITKPNNLIILRNS